MEQWRSASDTASKLEAAYRGRGNSFLPLARKAVGAGNWGRYDQHSPLTPPTSSAD